MKFLFLVSLFFLSTPSFAIYNGEVVSAEDPIAKSSIALTGTSINKQPTVCSGLVLRQNAILTVAHCADYSDFVARTGLKIQRKGTYEPSAPSIEIQKYLHNGKYEKVSDEQEKSREDIIILVLKEPLPKSYEPATLDFEDKGFSTEVKMAGYGAQNSFGKKINMLQPRTAAEDVELKSKTAKIIEFDKEVFKIDQKEGGLCSGDSGGPIYDSQTMKVLAIALRAGESKGQPCATTSFGLRLSSKKEWIKEQLSKIDTAYPSPKNQSAPLRAD